MADSSSGSSSSEEADAIAFLQQAQDRAAKLIEELLRDRADLESNLRTDPAVKAEGLASLDQMIGAARRVMEETRQALERRAGK